MSSPKRRETKKLVNEREAGDIGGSGKRNNSSQTEELTITKTSLYNFDTLKPHFYIVKLEFTGYLLFFLFLLKNIDCGYSLEPPRRGGSNE